MISLLLLLNLLLILIALFLIKIIIKQRREDIHIIYLLETFLNNEITDTQDERISSQAAHLLKQIKENQDYILESSHTDKDKLKTMISDLSHQLKTPLTNLKMYQSILNDEDLTLEEMHKFKKKLYVQINKIEWIIHSLINCMRLEENTITFACHNLPISETVFAAVDSIQLNADLKDIRIEIDNEINEKVLVYHNCNWTREVFVNVLENSLKYSKTNTLISIELAQTELYTIITIHDQGLGIAPQEYNLIFQRFYRSSTVKEIEGNGIGLYLCRAILEKENGYITIDSKLGKGSSFHIWLPNAKLLPILKDR